MDKAQAVVQRESGSHLPVVLDVELCIVVYEIALDIARQLVVRGENADGRVGEAEAGVQGVGVVVSKIDIACPALALLRLEAVRVVEASFERVRADEFRQVDGNVGGLVDVQPAREGKVRGSEVGGVVADAAAPSE